MDSAGEKSEEEEEEGGRMMQDERSVIIGFESGLWGRRMSCFVRSVGGAGTVGGGCGLVVEP